MALFDAPPVEVEVTVTTTPATLMITILLLGLLVGWMASGAMFALVSRESTCLPVVEQFVHR